MTHFQFSSSMTVKNNLNFFSHICINRSLVCFFIELWWTWTKTEKNGVTDFLTGALTGSFFTDVGFGAGFGVGFGAGFDAGSVCPPPSILLNICSNNCFLFHVVGLPQTY